MPSASDKMTAARCRLMTQEPWYGHMAMSIEWRESEMSWIDNEDQRTMGFRFVSDGTIQAFFNPDWVDTMSLERLFGAIEHSINHLVRLHTIRRSHRIEKAWDIATDMSVNGKREAPYIGYKPDNGGSIILPFDDMIFIPKDWPAGESAETYYEKLLEMCPEPEDEAAGGQFDQFDGSAVDDHMIWSQSEISEDEARQIVHDMVQEAAEKSRGNVPGHLEQVLEDLAKPIVRWRETLRQYLGTHVGNRRKTYSRANHRIRKFGFKGVSHHAASTVNVIVDTSGSIGKDELEQFFAEIEAISYRAKVFVLQWDAEFQGYDRYRRGDWKKITVKGRGGTDMAAPVDWLEENGGAGDVVVMLTDGYCNWPHQRNYPCLFVITTDTSGPDWGTEIRLKADH